MSTAELPAVARWRLRSALRRAREAKGLTQGDVAAAMKFSLSKVMRIESGEVTISLGDLRMVMPFLGIEDPVEVEELTSYVQASKQRLVFDPEYRKYVSSALLDLMQLETRARAVRYFNHLILPGFLQTREYAEAINERFVIDAKRSEVRVRARLSREDRVFSAPDPPKIFVVLDESVLHREVGLPEMMADQLRKVLRFTEQKRGRVRILPLRSPPIEMLASFVVVDMGGEHDAFLYRESAESDSIVSSPPEPKKHREYFERLWSMASDESASVELIRKRIAELVGVSGI